MSALPPLKNYEYIEPEPGAVEEVANWLRRRYPKHSDRNPLNWYDAFLVLEVSEITIRGYVEKGILENLTIPSLALFIARRDIVWERYGRPDDNEVYEHEQKLSEMINELNFFREANGKKPITLKEKIESLKTNLFSHEEGFMGNEYSPQKKKPKKKISFEDYYGITVDQKTFDFIQEISVGDRGEDIDE